MNIMGDQILFWATMIIGAVLSLYSVYYVVIALNGLRKSSPRPHTAPTTRFAVIIPTRNEAGVVGYLVDSLKQQDYPQELYDIIVAPNNCTDDTTAVAEAHGATLFEVKEPVGSKGEVLAQTARALLSKGDYDALCVFDADNLVEPDFLQRMNNALRQGALVATGRRQSKNPADSATATGSSMIYWMQNWFYNKSREHIGLSGLVNGSGFVIDMGYLRRTGGWNAFTMTEDYEYTAQCVLAGERVHYVHEAAFYDEQPITATQSWHQRRRWTTGYIQGMVLYLGKLLSHAFRRGSRACFDVAVTFLQPVTQVASLVNAVLCAILYLRQMTDPYPIIPHIPIPLLVAAVVVVYAAVCVFAAIMARTNQGEPARNILPGIFTYPLFLLSWPFITLASIFKRQTSWDPTVHIRRVDLDDLA